MTKQLRRTRVFVAAVATCAVLAGVFAYQAFAGRQYYCSNCTLGTSGVPAVSAQRSTYTRNTALTEKYVDLHIYNVKPGVGNVCGLAQNNTNALSATCNPNGLADARCHTLHGTGPTVATCFADYN